MPHSDGDIGALSVGKRMALGLLVLWMVGGPVLTQGFGVKNPFLPVWHMYRGWGSNVVVVELVRVDQGVPERLDRLALLGFPDGAPANVRRLRTPQELDRQLKAICEALPPGADLRVHAKVGRVRGWQVLRAGQRNACG